MISLPKVLLVTLSLFVGRCGVVFADGPVAPKVDTITVTVGGEVNKKGKFMLSKGATVADAFDAAGGLTIFAPAAKVRLIRKGQVMEINFKRLQSENSRGPELEDRDNLQVPHVFF